MSSYSAMMHWLAAFTYAMIGWSWGIVFGFPRGRQGFVWFVWFWPIVVPILIIKMILYSVTLGIRDGIMDAFDGDLYNDVSYEED